MKIAIIGAGSMGMTLARRLVQLGHHLSIASPRAAASIDAAIHGAELVILAIPTKVVVDLPRTAFAQLSSSTVVIDLGNYHPELRDGNIDAIDRGLLDSQWVAQQIGHPVIKAFNSIYASSLLDKGAAKGTPGRIALPVAGDAPDARATVLRLVDDLGFDPVDAGDLDDSWRQGTGTPAYCKDLDAAGLRLALDAADRTLVGEYRAREEARIRSSLAASSV